MRTNQLGHFTVVTDNGMSHGMHVACRTVRKNDAIVAFEVRFLSESLPHHFDDPVPVFVVNTIPYGLLWYSVLFRIQSQHAVRFGGPKHKLPPPRIPGPTACMTQALGFGQIGLAASQFTLRLPRKGHIRNRPDIFQVSNCISFGPSDGM